ncbi:dienelactone hydrolase family protein [Burkholderia ubonensis]|uniref:dienelactone hydrolase family protein n=1 Tax=Burkholderia ubonensis TaxID=101571 RepID=UPI001629B526|nr:dienelactone hydrolase family protein [Burkholderia ubonensis]
MQRAGDALRFQQQVGRRYAVNEDVAFYPGGPTAYLDDKDIAPRPVRVFAGTGDDYTPIAPCRAYVERLKAAGRDVSLTEYPGARHVFEGARSIRR